MKHTEYKGYNITQLITGFFELYDGERFAKFNTLYGAEQYINNKLDRRKKFYTMRNIGKAKYTINFFDGISKHRDGSDFYGIYIFSNKREFEKRQNEMLKEGYINI